MNIYSKKAERIIFDELSKANKDWATIHQYRNFTDYCIIPMIKRLHKEKVEVRGK